MSKVTTTVSTSNFLQNNYDQNKIFLGNNRYETVSITASGADVELSAGTLIGKIAATQKGVALASGSSDGSQFPFGVLVNDILVADGDTLETTVCVAGDVDEGSIVLDGSDTLNTVVSLRSIRDRIASDTLGIKLVLTDELSGFDN